jgi:hypothetical protein
LLGAVAVAELTCIEHAVSAGGGAVVVFGHHAGAAAAVVIVDAVGKLSVETGSSTLCSSQDAALAECAVITALWAVAVAELAFFNRPIATHGATVGICE